MFNIKKHISNKYFINDILNEFELNEIVLISQQVIPCISR